ncbi:hypothetical protein M413DRAFT_29076 [Hebeloma cylindrosporum]|uniref:Uncharacterized protein n=1 Tax=Hebeloma cylindrosporum TaxID=76867 RepID=A0A0C3C6S1_HEBCY|nr:hypothetical protein M413DRAFT_29076 [Hebeloma cylindrosporum h7]
MLTHNLASSPHLKRHTRSSSSFVEDSEVARNQTMVEDFKGPGSVNEGAALTSSITEPSELGSSIKEQEIVSWANNVQFSGESAAPGDATHPSFHEPHGLSDPEELINVPNSTPYHNSEQVRSHAIDSEPPIDQVLQEIQTLERIANRLDHLYSIRDRLIHRRSRRC